VAPETKIFTGRVLPRGTWGRQRYKPPQPKRAAAIVPSTPGSWRIESGAIIERLPIVDRDPEPWEMPFVEYRQRRAEIKQRWEQDKQKALMTPAELEQAREDAEREARELQERQRENAKKGEEESDLIDVVRFDGGIEVALDLSGVPTQRVTEADRTNNRKTVARRFSNRLYLIVRKSWPIVELVSKKIEKIKKGKVQGLQIIFATADVVVAVPDGCH